MRKEISLLLLLVLPTPALGQGLLDEFSYEGLRFSGVGIEIGGVASDRLQTEVLGGLKIDYGYFAPRVKLVFDFSFFKGDFDQDEIVQFERSLRRVVIDPDNNFSIDVGNISWSNFEADMDLLYEMHRTRATMIYGGVGLGVHLRNGSGRAIDGTFVEDALDTVAAGFNVVLGGEVGLYRELRSYVDLRLGLTSELNMASVRFGFMYRAGSGTGTQ